MAQLKVYVSGGFADRFSEAATGSLSRALERMGAKNYKPVIYRAEALKGARRGTGAGYPAHLRARIRELMECDAVYMLSDWELSATATLEHSIAKGLNMPVIYETEPRHRPLKEAIQAATGVPWSAIAGDSRQRKHVFARMIYAHNCRLDGDSVETTARETRHDSSSVTYYLRRYDAEYKYNNHFRALSDKVSLLLGRKK